jgi:hypothetical protein
MTCHSLVNQRLRTPLISYTRFHREFNRAAIFVVIATNIRPTCTTSMRIGPSQRPSGVFVGLTLWWSWSRQDAAANERRAAVMDFFA